uniref:Uncharacterized protein n=1 Tax=Eptatretus burgeri TaxID=7764 RepID=A0A8C4R8J0_EPTBU
MSGYPFCLFSLWAGERTPSCPVLRYLINPNMPPCPVPLGVAFAGYPLAAIQRTLLFGCKPAFHHVFYILTGLCLAYFNFGERPCMTFSTHFAFALGYLLLGYYYMATDSYDINWTMPQCVLTLRLIGTPLHFPNSPDPPRLGALTPPHQKRMSPLSTLGKAKEPLSGEEHQDADIPLLESRLATTTPETPGPIRR